MCKLIKAEQETIIRWDAEERIAHIDSAQRSLIAKLDRLVEAYPATYKCVFVDKHFYAKKYTVPASFISFRKPASKAQKETARERMKAIRKKKSDATKYADAGMGTLAEVEE
jgi:hypothetical protein